PASQLVCPVCAAMAVVVAARPAGTPPDETDVLSGVSPPTAAVIEETLMGGPDTSSFPPAPAPAAAAPAQDGGPATLPRRAGDGSTQEIPPPPETLQLPDGPCPAETGLAVPSPTVTPAAGAPRATNVSDTFVLPD